MLNITNTDLLFNKYQDQAPILLSKVYTVFHSIGIIFLGEPYQKGDLNLILWKKDKKDWLTKIKKYAIDLLSTNEQKSDKLKKKVEDNLLSTSKEEGNDKMISDVSGDLCVFTGVKFIASLIKNIKETLNIFNECEVKINLYASYDTFNQGFIGNKEVLDEIIICNKISELNKISALIDYDSYYPSLYLTDNIVPYLNEEIKKFIFPNEIILNQSLKKTTMIYRHYINYTILMKDNIFIETLADAFDIEKLQKKEIFLERKYIKKTITHDHDSLVNLIISDDSYIEIISGLHPTLRTLVNIAYHSLQISDFDKCLDTIKDIRNLNILPSETDPVMAKKIEKFEKYVDNILVYKSGTNYTKKMFK